MISNMLLDHLQKTGFVLISIMLFVANAAYGAGSAAKTDPAEWKKIVEAAKKEGKIVMNGDPSEVWRKSLIDLFRDEYPEITVEYGGMSGRNIWPRIRQERKVGKKLWDLNAGGAGTAYAAKREGFLDPIRPLLLPENADDSKWIGGLDGLFVDKENKFIPTYTIYIQHTTFVNRDFIKESELMSSEQLLDPKLKGKIVMQTPTGGATYAALGNLGFMYGENFVRDLLSKQNPVITDDNRQQTEWLVRGKYPIVIGFNNTELLKYLKLGLGKNIRGLKDKIIPVATSLGGIQLLKEAPHPNAAKVYINWLLSQKTQIKLTKNVMLNSRRTDVAPVDKETAVNPAHLNKYRFYATEEGYEITDRLLPVIRKFLQR